MDVAAILIVYTIEKVIITISQRKRKIRNTCLSMFSDDMCVGNTIREKAATD